MKNSLTVVLLAVSVLWLGGCFVFVGDRTEDSEDLTIAEIDAVGKLSFSSERKAAYERIAKREGLSSESQVHLVEAALEKLSFDSEKEDVLLKLIANPDFSRAAEREILESIDRLAFENSRKEILKAISDRKN